MDDNSYIYYLILGAIYLISRALKKKKPTTQPKPRPRQVVEEQEVSRPQRPSRPTSFEDILKELSQELNPEEQRRANVMKEEEKPAPIEVKEEPKEELTREQLYVKKRHKEMELERKLALKREMEEMEEEHEPHEVLELLREEGGAANAIILSEILNRKY